MRSVLNKKSFKVLPNKLILTKTSVAQINSSHGRIWARNKRNPPTKGRVEVHIQKIFVSKRLTTFKLTATNSTYQKYFLVTLDGIKLHSIQD